MSALTFSNIKIYSFLTKNQTKIGLLLLFLKCYFFLTVCAGQVIKSTMK